MKYELIHNSLNDLDNPIETILRNRGIDDVQQYLNLDSSVVQDYNDLNNMSQAVECFINHFQNKDKILVMPDEDCDGYTSSAMLYLYIKALDPEYPVEYLMHQRPKMHGLKDELDRVPDDIKLFIIADASTNDIDECNQLIDKGIDIIILDHHDEDYQEESEEEETYSGVLSNKAIIVNNQLSPNYKNKSLSGAGIVYRFLQALDEEFWEDYAYSLIDLCCLGNAADVMDMRSLETRFFVNEGLNNLNNKFLQALFKAQAFSMKGVLNIHTVTWFMSPVINAVTRMGTTEDRELLFRAMLEQDEEFDYQKRDGSIIKENIYDRAARIAKNIKSRQDAQRDKVFDELKNQVDLNDKVVFLESKIAQSGLVGLSAMKLADTIKRPVIIVKEINRNGEVLLSGSCRNYENSPILDFKDLILQTNAFAFCSGHDNAAGLAIEPCNIDFAKQQFKALLEDVDFDLPIPCDFIIDIDDLNVGFIQEIDQAAWIWGTDVKEPKIAIKNITVFRPDIHVQGKNFDSIAFMVGDIKFVMFKMAETEPLLEWASAWDGDDDDYIVLDAIVEVGLNEYKGVYTPQCMIKTYNITAQN